MRKKIMVAGLALGMFSSVLFSNHQVVAESSINSQEKNTKKTIHEQVKEFGLQESIKLSQQIGKDIEHGLANQSKKLGYMKGDTLELKTPVNWEEVIPKSDPVKLNDTLRIYGKNEFVAFQNNIKNNYIDGITIIKTENMNASDKMGFSISSTFDYTAEQWDPEKKQWIRVEESIGDYVLSTSGFFDFTGYYETAPKLDLEITKNVLEVSKNTAFNFTPDDFFEVLSSVGKTSSKFIKKPDFSKLGEQTAQIRVWDKYVSRYGWSDDIVAELEEEEWQLGAGLNREHYKTFDAKFNVVEKDDWEDGSTNGWKFFAGGDLTLDKDPANSLNGDYVFYSDKATALSKPYNLESGGTYRFTTYVKPDKKGSSDLVSLSLKANSSSGDSRELVKASISTLPSLEKGYRKVQADFTVENGEENPLLVFQSFRDGGIYIGSFKLEKIK